MRIIGYLNSRYGLFYFKFCFFKYQALQKHSYQLTKSSVPISGVWVATGQPAASFMACQFWKGRLLHNEIQLCLQDWSNWTAIPCQGWFVSSYHSFSSLQALLEPPFLSCKKHCERALCPLRAICLAIPPLF